jgi:hypothetical protein
VKVKNNKIKKFRGGGMDMGNEANQARSAAMGNSNVSAPGPGDTGGEGGFNPKDQSTTEFGNKGSSPTSTGNATANVSTSKASSFLPLSVQLIGNVANTLTEGYRTKKARGENILSKKVTLPSTRDYYKTTGKTLDVMSPEGKQYLIDDKRIPKIKPPTLNSSEKDSNVSLCPDGTTPPCKTPVTQIKNPVSTPNPFLSGFKAYDDGGEVIISGNVDKDLL